MTTFRILPWLGIVLLLRQAALPAADLPGLAVPDALGVNIHFTDPKPGEMDMLAGGGFRWIRMDFGWEGTERKKGQYDFTRFDRLLEALAPHKIRALFILDYANRNYDNGLSPCSDEGRDAFARWAAAAAKHFRGRGILWEMYNEPNIFFWKPKPDVQQYVKLALAVGRALREAEPNEMYIGPATSQIDLPFLEACFKAGLLEYWCAVSVHPYRQTDPETSIPEYRKLRRLIDRYAPRGKSIPILSGEWGYSSAWKNFDEARQGKVLPRQWLTNLACEVPLSIWYDWHDDGRDPKEPEHHFGTVLHPLFAGRTPVYDPKPSYTAAKTLAGQLAGYRFNKRIYAASKESDDDYLLLFQKGSDVRVVAWTTASEPGDVLIPASPGRFTAVDYLGKRLPALEAAAEGIRVRLTDTPQYLAPEKPNDFLRIAAAWQRAPWDVSRPAQGKATERLSVANPLDRPIRVFRVSGAAGDRSGAGDSQPPDAGRTIEPGRTELLEYAFRLSRSQETSREAWGLRVEGQPGEIRQFTDMEVTNPIRVLVGPITGKNLHIRLENPSGEPFDGSLQVFAEGLLQPGQHILEGDASRLAAGQRQRDFQFSLCGATVGSYQVGAAMGDGGRFACRRRTTIADFASHDAASLDRNWQVMPDGDRKVGSKQSVRLAAAPDGGPMDKGVQVLRIDYQFEKGWKFLRLVPKIEALRKIEKTPHSLGMWVYGDNSGNLLRMRFRDATGQTFQPTGEAMSWSGWKYVEFPFHDPQRGHWGGANDGRPHAPLQLDTLLLIDGTRRDDQGHEVYVCGPVYVADDDERPPMP